MAADISIVFSPVDFPIELPKLENPDFKRLAGERAFLIPCVDLKNR
ncbi:hypothetical protein QW060_15885 [Myroides ceti]|uniref:Uncharacterized protein n=1 Tax=Paenimyroides ceti TaxID=395087 RepID=A0ABT8CYD8_9FLAO|nr:hypothetical protein [Paenimyroides ceti]MDN3708582.1 hypothetical protein [Paenimyroides ceti]